MNWGTWTVIWHAFSLGNTPTPPFSLHLFPFPLMQHVPEQTPNRPSDHQKGFEALWKHMDNVLVDDIYVRVFDVVLHVK